MKSFKEVVDSVVKFVKANPLKTLFVVLVVVAFVLGKCS